MKKSLLILITLCITTIGYSQTFIDNFITYTVIPSTTNVEVTDYDMAGGTIVNIPTIVTNSSTTYNIISIGIAAFQNKGLTRVTIPNSITSIGDSAFQNNPLTCVISEATIPPTIITGGTNDSFTNRSGINLTIPTGTIATYVTDAGALWTGFGSVTEGLSATFVVNNITYQILPNPNNEVAITDYNTAGGIFVNIPATVNSACTDFSVVNIGVSAFQSKSLLSVTIPNSVINIDAGAFALNDLASVAIPNSVTNIGTGAFAANDLANVTIPNSVTSIGDSAFQNNPLTCVISEATIPPTIITGGANDSFATNRSGINLSIPTGTTAAYVTDAGALWTGFGSVAEGLLGTFVVDNITYQILPNPNNEVAIIDYNTAGGVTVVNIPASVNSGCTDFSVVTIDVAAFMNNALTSVTIPNSVTTIGNVAFRNNQLVSVTIPDSVISIGSGSFVNNQLNLTLLGNSITSIGSSAFGGNALTTITIPDSVTSIGGNAFTNNLLTSVTLGSGVLSIGNNAFFGNPLTSVISESIIPPIITTGGSTDTFENRNVIDLVIPIGTTGAYVTDAGALWTGFNSVTENSVLNVSNFELINDITVITTTDVIMITHSNNITLQNHTIYNISGILVAKGKESEIPTTFLASGIYILKLNFDKGTFTKKVLVN